MRRARPVARRSAPAPARPDRRPVVLVFVKAPRLGRVKTRLAREIGGVEATRWYRATTAALLRRIGRDPRWRVRLVVTPDGARRAAAWPAAIPRADQGRGDLGARMGGALAAAGPAPALLIGSDIPGVRPAHLAAALRGLAGADAVFGPAEDGGFWLVGLRGRLRARGARAFDDVRWSQPETLADAIAACGPEARIARAPTLRDVDSAADLRAAGAAEP